MTVQGKFDTYYTVTDAVFEKTTASERIEAYSNGTIAELFTSSIEALRELDSNEHSIETSNYMFTQAFRASIGNDSVVELKDTYFSHSHFVAGLDAARNN